LKMNLPEDSIEILISNVYQRNLSSDTGIRYDQLMEGPLGLFMGLEGTTKGGLQRMVISKMGKIFGNDITEHDRKGHPIFKIKCSYEMDEGQYIVPAASEDCHNLEELVPFLTGSKIVFKRSAYWHTGVILNKSNGEMDIIQLEKSANLVFLLKLRSAGDVLGVEPSPMMIDNSFLHGRGVNTNNLFYRFSRLAGQEVAYNATQLNCDVCTTFLMTGWTNWSTMKKFHRPFTQVSLPVKDGEITRHTLEELTEENQV
jgi:hypothetical protein